MKKMYVSLIVLNKNLKIYYITIGDGEHKF